MDTYGAERLRAGSGVLDVAGGRGGLGFELVNIVKAPTTVVDPRPLDLALHGWNASGESCMTLGVVWTSFAFTTKSPTAAAEQRQRRGKQLKRSSGQGSAGVAVDRLSSADSSTAAERSAARQLHVDWQLAREAAEDGQPRRPSHWGVCWQPELYGAVCSAAEQHRAVRRRAAWP